MMASPSANSVMRLMAVMGTIVLALAIEPGEGAGEGAGDMVDAAPYVAGDVPIVGDWVGDLADNKHAPADGDDIPFVASDGTVGPIFKSKSITQTPSEKEQSVQGENSEIVSSSVGSNMNKQDVAFFFAMMFAGVVLGVFLKRHMNKRQQKLEGQELLPVTVKPQAYGATEEGETGNM